MALSDAKTRISQRRYHPRMRLTAALMNPMQDRSENRWPNAMRWPTDALLGLMAVDEI